MARPHTAISTVPNLQRRKKALFTLILPKHLPLHRLKLSHDNPPPLPANPNIRLKRLHAAQKTLTVPCQIICINRLLFNFPELERPEYLRYREPQITLGEVDPGTQPPPRAVAVVVALGVGGRIGEVGGGAQRGRGVTCRVEDGWRGGREWIVV